MTDNPLRRKLALRNTASANPVAPCPFCGGEAVLISECAWGGLPANHHVGCIECGARTAPMFTEIWTGMAHVTQDSAKLATERWNRRSAPQPPRPPAPKHRTGLAPRKD